LRSRHGAAAAEFAILVPVLTLPLLNIVDLGYYAYQRMQVGNAALAGAEEARSFCNTAAKLPATSSNCPGFGVDEAIAINSTSLGSHVALVSGYPLEGYYCTLTTGALQLVGTTGTIGNPPAGAPDCTGVTGASSANAVPGDYIQVQVTYTYTSVFPGMTVAALLPGTITQTSWSRLQ
jgi:Flp pilus assembly protein TadG